MKSTRSIGWLACGGLLLAALLGLASFSWSSARPPSLTLPAEVHGKPGRPIALDAQTTGALVRWHGCGDIDLLPTSPHQALVWGTVPGRYRVFAWTAGCNQPSEAAWCDLVIDGPGPTPGPTPSPGGPLHVTVFIDVSHPSSAVATLIESSHLRQALADAGHHFRVFDVASATGRQFAALISQAGGPPALVIQTKEGRALTAIALPSDEAALLAEVKKVGG